MHHAKVTDAGRVAGSWYPENLAPCDHIPLGYTRSSQIPRCMARYNPLEPDKRASSPAGQLVKGMRAPQRHSQSVTHSPGTTANRREAGPAPPPTCSPLAPHPTAPSQHLGPQSPARIGVRVQRRATIPVPGTAMARCPAMQERDGS